MAVLNLEDSLPFMQLHAVLLNPLQVTVPHGENKKFKLHVSVEQRVKDAYYYASQSFCF